MSEKRVPVISGLIHVTGEPDTGKTTFTLATGVEPEKICFFDNDLKTQAVADDLAESGHPFGYYVNLVRGFAQYKYASPIAFHDYVVELLDAILAQKKGNVYPFQVFVFDNWSRMEDGIRAYSLKVMPQISSLTPGQIRNMSQLTWPYTYAYYAEFLDKLLSIAPTVFLVTHIRAKYIGSKKTDQIEARGQRPLIEKSTMRVWMRHNPDSPAPIGLILKRPQKMVFEGGALLPVSILPRRVKPCTWEKIEEYWRSPIGNTTPSPEEVPDEFELSILDGTLTEDQKVSLRLALVSAEQEDAEEAALLQAMGEELKERVQAMRAEGMSPPVIAKELDITVAEVGEYS
jgi:hypothetical protein